MPRLPTSLAAITLLALTAGLASCGSSGEVGGFTQDAVQNPPPSPPVPFEPSPPPAAWADDACVNCHGTDGGGTGGGPNIQCTSFERLDAHLRTVTTSHVGGAFPALTDADLLDLVAFLRTADCPGGIPGDPTIPPPSTGIPSTHTKSEDGVLHHADYETNLGTCTACHGVNLEGTTFAPSCASCHSGDGFDEDDEDDEDDGDD